MSFHLGDLHSPTVETKELRCAVFRVPSVSNVELTCLYSSDLISGCHCYWGDIVGRPLHYTDSFFLLKLVGYLSSCLVEHGETVVFGEGSKSRLIHLLALLYRCVNWK